MSGLRARAIDRLRQVFGHPWLLPMTALLLRARTVRPSVPFVLRELFRRRRVAVYQLADGGLRVAIRHRTGDVVTLGEVFHDHDYVPEPEVESALDGVRTIVDLGANIGLFGAFAAGRWPLAEISGFEPDPGNVAAHEQTIAANDLGHRWNVVPAAAGACEGQARFLIGRAALSRIAEAGEPDAITVPMLDVLPVLAGADLVKIDIEGGEWAILDDPRFRQSPPRAVVLEYHPYLCPTDDPRSAAESVLREAGLRVLPIKQRPGGHGMLWGWRV